MTEAIPLLILRPAAQAAAFAAALEVHAPGRFAPRLASLVAIELLRPPLDLAGTEALVFTSANGVAAFAALGLSTSLTAYCVGTETAAAARSAGLAAIAAGGTAAELVRTLIAAHRPGGGAFLHLHGRHVTGDLVAQLHAAGVSARGAVLYDQPAVPLPAAVRADLASARVAAITFFSPRAARLFASEALDAAWPLTSATAVAISPGADAALRRLDFGRHIIAATPDRAGMLAALDQVPGGPVIGL